MIREAINELVQGRNLTREQAREVMTEIMEGNATPAQLGAFLVALKMKQETVEEITAFAEVMRQHCRRIAPKVNGRLVDTCGTGGDKIKTFNVSTAAAFVAAGARIPVAKHGNRSVTSRCGSADVLEALGLNLSLEPQAVESIIEKVGVGFMFAPVFHPAMRHAAQPRKEIGVRTVFNILGPLTNPAGAKAQLLGVYDSSLTETLARVLLNLGLEEGMVVHGLDGLDEISIIGRTRISQLRNGNLATEEISPNDLGLRVAETADIAGTEPKESAEIVFMLLSGRADKDDAKFQMLLANGAAAIVVGGKATDLKSGVELARESIQSGAAYSKLRELIKVSGGNGAILEELEARYG